MQTQPHVKTIIISGKEYELVKTRLNGGGVYKLADSSVFLRIGEPYETAAEHIHIQSLRNKGYPVGEILEAGKINRQYYFIEKSLGKKSFGVIFGEEFSADGVISDSTFNMYRDVVIKYARASFNSANFLHAKANVKELTNYKYVITHHNINEEKLSLLLDKAQDRINKLPRTMVHADLGPFNIMPGGVIDFEMSEIGPVGYDVYAGPMTGYFFPRSEGYHYKLLYEFSDQQHAQLAECIGMCAKDAGLHNLSSFVNDFMFMRTVWAATRSRQIGFTPEQNSEKEKFWQHFRYEILMNIMSKYENDELIIPKDLPAIGEKQYI